MTDPRKILANFGLILVFALFAPLLVLGTSHSTANLIPPILFSFLFFFLVGGSILFGFYRAYRHLHVYVYTNGLFYSNGARRRVVYWPQVVKASLNRGYLTITVKNEAWLSIPTSVSRSGELRDRIEQKIANSRTLG